MLDNLRVTARIRLFRFVLQQNADLRFTIARPCKNKCVLAIKGC